MTPKEKAGELVNKYSNGLEDIARIADEWSMSEFSEFRQIIAMKCALIAVDEMIEIRNEIVNTLKLGAIHIEIITFLEEVKQEIEKL